MLVTGAPTRRHAMGAVCGLREEFPTIAAALDQVSRGGAGWSFLVLQEAVFPAEGVTEESAARIALTVQTVGDESELALAITWADGSVQTLGCWELVGVQAVAPELPACSAFVGDGVRCSACRIRKAMHA